MIIATIVYAVTKLFNIPVFVAIVTLLVKLLLGCNNKPMPSFLVESRKLVKKDLLDLDKSLIKAMSDKPIYQFALTQFWFWNAGRKTLHFESVSKKAPLELNFSGDGVFETAVVQQTNFANDVSIINNNQFPNVLTLQFDYLDSGDGVVVQILHEEKVKFIEVTGCIKGIPKGLSRIYPPKYKIKSVCIRNICEALFYFSSWIIFAYGCLLTGLTLMFMDPGVSKFQADSSNIIYGLFCISIGLFFVLTNTTGRPRKLKDKYFV